MKKAVYLFIFTILVAVLLGITAYLINIHSINRQYHDRYNPKSEVALRKFPYPYRAAISICSDIDNTESLEKFLEIQKFLNTREMTSMGEGVGLEIGNSFIFYEPPHQGISYFWSSRPVRESIIGFIKSGQIDVMHSYGKKGDFTREDAVKSLAELKENKCKVDVWVDHDKSISNLGDDVTFGLGDHLDSKTYHADLTLNYGIKFVWLGRISMIAGQSAPVTIRAFTSIFNSDHPILSVINISKEFAKNAMGVFGNKKYAMHKDNELVRVVKLDDGNKVYEFIRFDNSWKGVATNANSRGLAYMISRRTLNHLKEVGGYMIVYTHLGMNSSCQQYICPETQDALRDLAKEFEEGIIYVTTTSKLLNYYIRQKYLDWSYDFRNGMTNIYIHDIQDPILGVYVPKLQDLEGITFYVSNKGQAKIYLGKNRIESIRRNPADYRGKESLTITSRAFENN